jgi:hypothetical protein
MGWAVRGAGVRMRGMAISGWVLCYTQETRSSGEVKSQRDV